MAGNRSWAARGGRVLLILGTAGMVIGAIDPLEGAAIILPASGVAALGGGLLQSRYRRLLYWGFGLITAGVGALAVLSAVGGTGGETGRSHWWGLFMLPYPAGWIVALAGCILSLRELRRSSPPPAAPAPPSP